MMSYEEFLAQVDLVLGYKYFMNIEDLDFDWYSSYINGWPPEECVDDILGYKNE